MTVADAIRLGIGVWIASEGMEPEGEAVVPEDMAADKGGPVACWVKLEEAEPHAFLRGVGTWRGAVVLRVSLDDVEDAGWRDWASAIRNALLDEAGVMAAIENTGAAVVYRFLVEADGPVEQVADDTRKILLSVPFHVVAGAVV
jgi:hypothetical protein